MDEKLLKRMYKSLGGSLRSGRINEEDAIAYVIYADAIAGNESLLESLMTIGINEGIFLDIDMERQAESQTDADMERIFALKRQIHGK